MAKRGVSFREKAGSVTGGGIPERIISLFGLPLKEYLRSVPGQIQSRLEEIRLRVERPVVLRTHAGEWFLGEQGVSDREMQGYICQKRDIQVLINQVSGGALYSLEEELRSGFITIPGGHRLGFAGQAVLERGQLKTITHISAVNIRLARQVTGCAGPLLPYLLTNDTVLPHNTLIVSPPQCGKTTLLRDIIRHLSSGPGGVQVGVVDERSEIAGCYRGVPQLNLGPRVDVLDRCPKAQGMILLVRSMSPQVVATDEIGRQEDAAAVMEMRNAGVKVITTVHGSNLAEIRMRPQLAPLISQQLFDRYIILSRSLGVGTVEQVLDGNGKKLDGSPLRLAGGGGR